MLRELYGFNVNLGYQGTGRVDHFQVARLADFAHRGRHTVGRENYARAFGHFFDFVDEDGALLRQFIDHVTVVNNFAADINRGAKGLQRDFDNIDGAHHARAETARLEQQYPLGSGGG